MLPSSNDVRAAAARLTGVIARTPLVRSPELSARVGVEVYLKCEQLQTTGSFKLRGAYNALATLPAEVRARGVVASSAGATMVSGSLMRRDRLECRCACSCPRRRRR